ncbi:LamG domain-containing protein [Streptomyces prunicolor]|uniref:LamG domain-containing protein n=1 Tax=Streptomyces prunicolor TaxID=67348 RepID=UPI0003A13C42|nr:LamG domain-containing protein [Streptomyces prunicolor]
MRSWSRRIVVAAAAAIGVLGVLVAPATTASAATTCTTYYVSSASGSDSNDGCTTSTPWKTLTNVNATTFTAGNQILFQDGGSWTGELHPLGSGASGNQIVVSNYGSGAAPIIGGGGADAAVYLDSQQYWTIQNLEITNTTTTAAVRSGIQLQNDTSGILHGIHILNNNIHDVKGTWGAGPQPSTSSGIAFNLNDNNSTNGWDDVLLQGNTLTKVDAGGIYLGSLNGTGHSILTSNVVIQNNTLTDMGGNDVVCVYCDNPLVQNNVATNSGYRFSGAGFWMALNNNGIWQNNEISRQWRALWDGEAFDIDHDNTGTIIQYNYTHDNPFGFQEYCCSSTFGAKNSIVRYNISQNDGSISSVLPTLEGVVTTGTAQVYNNTIYLGPGDNGGVNAGTTAANNIVFSNNLIYNAGSGGSYSSSGTWTHNLFYGTHDSTEPTDASKVTTDPRLVAPGGASSGLSSAAAYKLQPGSPAIGAGVLVSGNGGLDYFGNTVSSTAAPNIGAYNGSGVTPTASYGARWNLDEGTGTTAADTTNDHNTGTLQSGASWTTGKVGTGAVSLTGASNSYVDVPTTAIDTGASYSVSAWVKLNSLSGNQTIASIDGSSISPFYLQLTGGTFAFTTRSSDSTGSTATQVTGGTPVTGTWYHLTGVYDNSAHTIALYVNGTLQGTTAFSSPWKATGHTVIGRAKWNGNAVDFTNGTIDDVRMFSKALNRQEAVALATAATADYEFDEGTGSNTSDFMGNSAWGGLNPAAAWAGSGKVGGNAVSLDGTAGTEVNIPVVPVDTSASYSVAAWVKLNSLSGNQTFVSVDGGLISPFYLQLTGGKFAFAERGADSTTSTLTSVTGLAPSTGTWYHVVGVYNSSASTISLYVNGTLQASTAFSSAWKAVGPTQIGSAWWNDYQVDFTNGQIDDVHFYNRALNTTEINQLAAG